MERNCLNCPINKIPLSERKRHENCNFDLKTEKTICCAYKCHKISAHELGKQFDCPESTIDRILEHYGIARRTLVEAQALRFERAWAFPYTNYVTELTNRGWKNQLSKLIAVMLLTDGTITFPKLGRRYRKGRYRNVVAFGGREKLNHKIFADLMKYTFDINPSSFCIEVGKGYFMTIYERQDVKPVIEHLMTLSPNYKKSPNRKETVKEYLSQPQPTLSFLSSEPVDFLNEAVRLAMNCEGNIGAYFNIMGAVYGTLNFACAHPKLAKEWNEIFFKVFGTKGRLSKRTERWSGIQGLRIWDLEALEKFDKLGGFIGPMKITKKSKYYSGLRKNSILKAILWANKNLRLPRDIKQVQKHMVMRKVVEKIEKGDAKSINKISWSEIL